MRRCKLCEEFYTKYPLESEKDNPGKLVHHIDSCYYSSPIVCAFDENGKFKDIWSCETMIKLRGLCGEDEEERAGTFHYRDDFQNGTIGVLSIPENDELSGYLVMNWYKSRGRTDRAHIMDEDNEPKEITLEQAEKIISLFETPNATT